MSLTRTSIFEGLFEVLACDWADRTLVFLYAGLVADHTVGEHHENLNK